jgi:hypothetical protein
MNASFRICAATEQAVGHRDAQHVGVSLQVEAVHQAQRSELVLAQLAVDAALHLVPVLLDALSDDAGVHGVVSVHVKVSPTSRHVARPPRL